MDIVIPKDREAKAKGWCGDCLRRGRRGGFAKFPQGSPGLRHWRDRHAKHERGAA